MAKYRFKQKVTIKKTWIVYAKNYAEAVNKFNNNQTASYSELNDATIVTYSRVYR